MGAQRILPVMVGDVGRYITLGTLLIMSCVQAAVLCDEGAS